jgi:hypothetical protein
LSRFAAVIRTLGVLSVGASACGSSSSTGTHGSTSSVVKKEAGLLHVELVVYNMTGHSLDLQLCDGVKPTPCKTYVGMECREPLRTTRDAGDSLTCDGPSS